MIATFHASHGTTPFAECCSGISRLASLSAQVETEGKYDVQDFFLTARYHRNPTTHSFMDDDGEKTTF